MTCCKSEEFGGWCKKLKDYTHYDEQSYCIFHLPKIEFKELDNFTKEFDTQVSIAKRTNQKCDLSGTIFPPNIDFGKYQQGNPLPNMYFTKSIFTGKVNFKNCFFGERASFGKVLFQDLADFGHCIFNNELIIGESTFEALAQFSGCKFNGEVHFNFNKFNGGIHLTGSKFLEPSTFGGNYFAGRTSFDHCTFQKHASIAGSLIHKCKFSGKSSFNRTEFHGDTYICRSSFVGLSAIMQCTFIGNVTFSDIDFKSDLLFSKNRFRAEAIFDNITFNKKADLSRLKTEGAKLAFTDIDFKNSELVFLETDLTNIRFERCDWPQKYFFGFKIFGGTDVLYDEIIADSKFWGSKKIKWLTEYNKFSKYYVQVGTLYRQLKQNYKERHNESEASKWHYREKEMFRKEKWWRRYNPLSFSNLYWIFSGYGERPVRAGLMLLLLLVLITVISNYIGIKPNGLDSQYGVGTIQGFSKSPDWLKFWLVIQNTAQYVLFVKNPDYQAMTISGKLFLLISSRIIVPVQSALFAFALRNKFRR